MAMSLKSFLFRLCCIAIVCLLWQCSIQLSYPAAGSSLFRHTVTVMPCGTQPPPPVPPHTACPLPPPPPPLPVPLQPPSAARPWGGTGAARTSTSSSSPAASTTSAPICKTDLTKSGGRPLQLECNCCLCEECCRALAAEDCIVCPGCRQSTQLRGKVPPLGLRAGGGDGGMGGGRQAVGRGCQSGWGRLRSVTNAVEAGTWRQGGQWLSVGWAPWRGGGRGVPPPLPTRPWGRPTSRA